MIFKEVYEALKQGAMIKLPEWAGYWKWENNSIKMYCKNGKILDIRETEDVDYTLKNIMRDDWEIVGGAEVKDLNIQTFTFGEAIRNLKLGKKVARKGWNGKGMFLFLVRGQELYNPIKYNHEDININQFPPVDVIAMKTVNSVQVGWLASQTDMLATDWSILE